MQKMPATLYFVEPMECKPIDNLPEGAEWQHEIKFDDYRAIAIKQSGEVKREDREFDGFVVSC
jgi:ATP-dependent DNA ligase